LFADINLKSFFSEIRADNPPWGISNAKIKDEENGSDLENQFLGIF